MKFLVSFLFLLSFSVFSSPISLPSFEEVSNDKAFAEGSIEFAMILANGEGDEFQVTISKEGFHAHSNYFIQKYETYPAVQCSQYIFTQMLNDPCSELEQKENVGCIEINGNLVVAEGVCEKVYMACAENTGIYSSSPVPAFMNTVFYYKFWQAKQNPTFEQCFKI